jgi:group I intron endonuclease
MNNIEDAAQEYLDLGFSIIPIAKGSKEPPKGFKWKPYQQIQPTPEEVESWFEQWPDIQIALVTGMISGIGAIDADGPKGIKWLKETAPATSVYQKTAKGWHAFYKLTYPVYNRSRFLPELDVRGQGGYVLIAPSAHTNGTKYELIFPIESQGWEDITEFPYDLVQPDHIKSTITLEPVTEGERNDTLARIVGKYIAKGLNIDEITNLCTGWNLSCAAPLPQKELETTVTSIFKTYYRKHPLDLYTEEDIENIDLRRTEPNDPVEIYKLTSPSGKSYIGQTKQGVEERIKQHFYDNKCDSLIHKALKKYGIEAFNVEILYTKPAHEVGEYEKRAIKEHNTISPNGYNIATRSDLYNYRQTSESSESSKSSELSHYKHPISNHQAEQANFSQNSIPKDAKKYTQTLTQEIREWILQQTGNIGIIDIDREFCLQSRNEKNARSAQLNYLKKQGKVVPVTGKVGIWRVLKNDLVRLNPLSVAQKSLKIPMPLDIYDLVDIYPKNIIIVAGAPNSGKTTFALNLAFFCALLDCQARNTINNYLYSYNNKSQAEDPAELSQFSLPNGKIRYFNSEMAETELSKRVGVFPDADIWTPSIEFYERTSNFEDVIDPNGINIIDYLSVYENFWEVGLPIKEIHETLKTGIAIICLQKKPGAEFAKGGAVTLEIPRLVINLDNNAPFGGIARIVKAKAWATKNNPNGLERDYKIIDGWKIKPVTDWQYVSEKDRSRINKGYESEKAERRDYAYEFRLEDGTLAGLNFNDREAWLDAYPNIDVDSELDKLRGKLEFRSWLKRKNWFFQVAAYLKKLDTSNGKNNYQGESG